MRRPGFFRLISGRGADPPPRKVRVLHVGRLRLRHERHLGDLRRDHPLARASEAVRCTGRQWNHVAAMLVGSVIARAQGGRWASGLVCSAGGVLVVLSLLLLIRVQARRDCVTDAILEEGEDLPVAVVQRRFDGLSPRAIASGWRGVWRTSLVRPPRLGPAGHGSCHRCLSRESSHRSPTSCGSSALCCKPSRYRPVASLISSA